MKRVYKYDVSFFLVFFLFSGILSGQNILKTANNLYKNKEYCKAIHYYNQYLGIHSSKDIYFKRGICHYHCRDLDLAIEDIENSIILGNLDKETNLYLAKSWQDKQEFEKAINYYKLYLVDVFKNDNQRTSILEKIKKCSNGVYHKYRSTDHFIENWGGEMNSANNDILPFQSPDNNSRFYFSSDRLSDQSLNNKYRVFNNEFMNGNWGKITLIAPSDPQHNLIFLDFYKKQKELLFFLGYEKSRGTIYSGSVENGQIDIDLKVKFNGPIKSELGFNHLTVINDSTIVFSSKMPGGFGGYDLYVTGIRKGSWFKPVNLGPVVNSIFNEISPFISLDGRKLFFSSDNPNSIGGYDIFSSEFDDFNIKWTAPKNMGLPVNSTSDEVNFRVLNSGLGAIFSSDRRDQGYGGFDNYWLYFKNSLDITSISSTDFPFITILDLESIDDSNADQKNQSENTPKTNEPAKNVEVTELIKESIKEDEQKQDTIIQTSSKLKPDLDSVIFDIPMIYFRDDDFSDNAALIKFLDRLANLMMKNKDLNVEFVGNAFTWGVDKQDLVRSARMAQKLSDSMQLRMINKSRIFVKGSGYNFPYAKTDGPERSKNIITKINNRIDVYLHGFDPDHLLIKEEEIFLNRNLLDTRHTLYETIIDGLTYRVQMKSGNFLVLAENQSDYNDSAIEYDPVSGIYTYTVGIYKEYKQAKVLLEKLLDNYHTNSAIIPYINGLRIEKKDIIYHARKYNDLLNYMAENK